jgi:hypothetical protein
MRSIAVNLLVCSAAFAALAVPAGAETVSLAPSVVQLKGYSGQSATQVLRLTNQTTRDLAFTLEARDVMVYEGKRVFVNAGQVAGSIAATAVFSEKSIMVPAGGSRSATITVTVPEHPSTRAVVAVFKGSTNFGGGGTAATASLGTLLTFTLSDEISIEPGKSIVAPPSATTNASFSQSFLNNGAEPAVVKGVAVILDQAGRIAGKSAFEPRRTLPGEYATLRTEYAGELPKGSYRVMLTFEFQGRVLTRTADLIVTR